MTPGQYRRGGAGVEISYVCVHDRFGRLAIGATDRGICFLQFGDSPDELERACARVSDGAICEGNAAAALRCVGNAIDRYLKGEQPHLDLPLDIRATAFQLRVWRYLQNIPYGDLQSYAEVAQGSVVRVPRAQWRRHAERTSLRWRSMSSHHPWRRRLGGYRWGFIASALLIDLERAHRAEARP